MRGNYNGNKPLQAAWNKYGEENFDFIIIHDCTGENLDTVNALEISEIAKYKKANLAYNIHDGGDIPLFLGKHLSDETKRKIGEKNRVNMLGKKASEETKRKMSKSQLKRYANWTDEDRAKWSDLIKRTSSHYHWNDEQKKKMKGNKNGATYTIEQVREIRRLHEQENKSNREISDIMNIPIHTVYQIATYRRWKEDK